MWLREVLYRLRAACVSSSNWRPVRSRRRYYYGVQRKPLDGFRIGSASRSSSFLSLRSPLPVDPVVNLVVVKPRALHQLHLGAFRADDVVAVGDKATSDQRSFAARADEAIVMPVPVLEWDEASATNTCKLIDANGAQIKLIPAVHLYCVRVLCLELFLMIVSNAHIIIKRSIVE